MATTTRTWTGTPLHPSSGIPPHECDDVDHCSLCTYVVDVPIRTADGRTVVAHMTPDQAEALADQIKNAAEMARALAW
jgi:hypothetical protein